MSFSYERLLTFCIIKYIYLIYTLKIYLKILCSYVYMCIHMTFIYLITRFYIYTYMSMNYKRKCKNYSMLNFFETSLFHCHYT